LQKTDKDVWMERAVIVVPCYNEADRLDARRFVEFSRQSNCADFLFVNDGSRDGTQAVLESLVAENPQRFSLLRLPRNCGKAEAVRHGIIAGLSRDPAYIGFWDADLATPLDDIPGFCRVLDDKSAVEMVFGVRIPLLGRAIERHPLRNLCGQVFAVAASLVLGVRFQDTQCGAKLLRVNPQSRELFSDPFICRWIFDVEFMARIVSRRRGTPQPQLGRVVYEYPLDQWRDVGGSKFRPGDFSVALVDMGRIYWKYLRPGMAWLPQFHGSLAISGHPHPVAAIPSLSPAAGEGPKTASDGEKKAA
jgi:glycosyltransferase involved in cell wall biosynthesis